jgi:hypothetical protein
MRNASEDDIIDDKEVPMNLRKKDANAGGSPKAGGAGGEHGQSFSRLKSTEDIRKEIEKMGKKLEEEQKAAQPPINEAEKESDPTSSDVNGEQGLPDSDSEENSRLLNMRDADKRRFNVNDILGDFDRDERGHPLIL